MLILGASGFISTHLQAWCRRQGVEFLAVSSEQADLTREDGAARLAQLVRRDDSVVMTSGLPRKDSCGLMDYRGLMANLRMVETVIAALERAPCAHFVYLSSDAVYCAEKIPLDEDSTRAPTDHYSLSHIGREMMACAELERLAIPLAVLRLTAIYGPGDTHGAYGPNRFVRSALKDGRITLIGSGEERRSHVYIDDAVDLIGRSLMHRSAGILNVATRHALSFRKVAEEVIRLAGKPVEISHQPRTVKMVHRTFVDSALFEAFPDFQFTSIESGLGRFITAERR